MKRILKKAGILLLVFLLGTAGTALLLNSESTDNRSDFNDAGFPEVMVDMNDTLIKVEDLCKIYNPGENEVRALDHVSLEIKKGELVGGTSSPRGE